MEDEPYWSDDGRNEEQPSGLTVNAGEKSPLCHAHLPIYTQRQPPLVQPLETSAFAERTFGKYGVRDLGHEWVTLFQTIGEGNCGGYSKSMKLHVPDTILLSPSGYVRWSWSANLTCLSRKEFKRVTPQSILEALISNNTLCGSEALSEKDVVAIRRVGFQVESLTLHQLKAFCRQMEHPRVVVPRHEWEEDEDDVTTDDDQDSGQSQNQQGAFCLQRYIARHRDVFFLTLWRCKHRKKDPKAARDNVTDAHYARSFYKRPLPLLTSDISSKCDLFLVSRADSRRGRSGDNKSVNARTAEEDDAGSGSEDECETSKVAAAVKKPQVLLTHLDLDSTALFEDSLRVFGFDEDVILPQLCHMKLTASEILNRLNRGLQARQASGILCEFFVGARDKKVYFSGLAGTHWEGSEPSWEKLSQVDAISKAVTEFLASKKKGKQQNKALTVMTNSTTNRPTPAKSALFAASAMFPSASQYSNVSLTQGEDDAALRLYNELNPRFPSVESPYVSEQQWRFQSPLLPPDVSPRYIGAQVPKSYRDGKFHSLLTPKQADSVNRLNLSPRPPVPLHVPPRGSLSKQYAKLQQLGPSHSGGAAGANVVGTRRPTMLSPHKLSSVIPLVGTDSTRRAPQ